MTATQLHAHVTVKAADLVRVITDVLPFAGRDATLDAINAVCLEAADGVLSATATDRYTLGHARTTCTGSLPGKQPLRLADALMVTRLFKPTKATGNPTVQLTATAGEHPVLRFAHDEDETLGTAPVLGVGVRLSRATFPDYVDIIRKSTRDTQPVGVSRALAINPTQLARFARVSRSFTEPARLYTFGPMKPVVVEIGESFTGLIMPIRLSDKEPGLGAPVVPVGHGQPEPTAPAAEAA